LECFLWLIITTHYGHDMTIYKISEKCLNKYWNSYATDIYENGGWDRGSNSHRLTVKWVENNYLRFSKMRFSLIYKEYLIFMRQE
jgi:hypothetical protein